LTLAETLLPDDVQLLPSIGGVDWLRVAQGESGDGVFRRSDGAAYGKIAHGDRAAALDEERERNTWASTMGLSVPRVLDWIVSDHGACLVTAPLPGVPASTLSSSPLRRAWPSLVRQLARFHALPVSNCPFDRRLSRMLVRAADVVARDAVNPDFLAPEDKSTPARTLLAQVQAEVPLRLTQEARDLVVCHGDACLPNFLVDPDSLQCTGTLDLGRAGVADRYADLALLTANARESWASDTVAVAADAELFTILGIAGPDSDRLAFYLRLDPLTWG
jgi:streptomycin 3"-kinase